jgi:hypothetical protein
MCTKLIKALNGNVKLESKKSIFLLRIKMHVPYRISQFTFNKINIEESFETYTAIV